VSAAHPVTADLVVWGPDRAAELAELWAVSAPHEAIGADEFTTVCWDDPGGVVLATADGRAAVAAVVRDRGGVAVGHVRLVVVHPELRRRGVGTQLLAAAEAWLGERGAQLVCLAAEAPVYLWPGVDVANVAAQCLAEAAGYALSGSDINMALPPSFRAPVPPGAEVRRLLDDGDAAAMRFLVAEHWPEWLVEFDLGVEGASVHGAFIDGAAVGFCAHSVLRPGWLGPMATDPARRGEGLGAALVSAVATDLMVAGFEHVEIGWVGPVRFYAKLGATVCRSFRSYAKALPGI
jgi:mycothiol synthase